MALSSVTTLTKTQAIAIAGLLLKAGSVRIGALGQIGSPCEDFEQGFASVVDRDYGSGFGAKLLEVNDMELVPEGSGAKPHYLNIRTYLGKLAAQKEKQDDLNGELDDVYTPCNFAQDELKPYLDAV